MKHEKDDWDFVEDMIEAGEAIIAYSKGGKANFLRSPMAQDAVIRRFEVMGESAQRLRKDIRDTNPDIPWRSIIAFRNRLIHGYDEIEMERVWEAVGGSLREALPRLRKLAGKHS